MEPKRLKRGFYTVLILAGIALGVSALILLGQTTQNSEKFGRLHNILLIINAAAALVLLAIIGGNLIRLLREYRRGQPGARLKARMLTAFVGLAIGPLLIVYVFAVQFLNRGIQTWFDLEMERGLGNALTLSRSVLDARMREDLDRTRQIAADLAGLADDAYAARLEEVVAESGALEVTIFGDHDRIIATNALNPAAALPSIPPSDASAQARQSGVYIGLDPFSDGSYQIRSIVQLPASRTGAETRILQALYPVGERLGMLVDSVENTYTLYNELLFLREPLKTSYTVTLTLVVLLSFLAAVYGAFFFGRRLVAPIQSLVAGTRSVAEGDLDTRLPEASHDEIGFLIDSFNRMIQRLAEAREDARTSAQQVEAERAQLEAILARLSTGVISVDSGGRVDRANAAAGDILGVDLSAHQGAALADLAPDHPLLDQFMTAFMRHLQSDEREWREELTVRDDSGRRVLVCACTELPTESGLPGGNVIVFDDVTTLMQAQRDAAWGEVARRLAHEIKNPLTPIQLSAERIRRRYLGGLKDMEAQVLDQATHTIVQQVEAMRDMVNAFSDYARAPEINISRFEINQMIKEVAYLYRTRDNQPALELELDERLSYIDADAVRVRQLLHNLIRNAMEATGGQDGAVVRIVTRLITAEGGDSAEILVIDNGPGIPAETLEKIFEPYVTTKAKGSGLGLAIVKKLVEEHGGSVAAENIAGGGARIRVRLPVNGITRDSTADGRGKGPDIRRERA